MFQYIKVEKHKAIIEASLNNLGQLNILCGKNNSGKTSVLEALMKEGSYYIGKNIATDLNWLKEIFKEVAQGYSSPTPHETIPSFNRFIDEAAKNNYVLYEDKIPEFENMLRQTSNDAWRILNNVFARIFEKSKKNYKPLLIPAKRAMQSVATIQTEEKVQPDGLGILNKLFNLKNQDVDSAEYKTYKKILTDFNEITGHTFRITTQDSNQIVLSFRNQHSDWARSDNCGMGLSDVLVIIYHSIDNSSNFLLIEEAESHLHPEMQKKLLSFIKKIKSKQFIVSTHSSIFLNPFIVDKIFYSQIIDQVVLSDETHKSEILHSLGYSVTENIVSDIVILTEGPTDIPVFTRLLQLNGILEKYNIRFWPLGGDIMAQLNLDVFAERSNVLAIVDSDPKSSIVRTRFMKNCKEKGVKCIRLKRYAIENYFSINALKSVLKDDFPKNLDEVSPNIKLDEQLGFEKNGKVKKGSIKALNSEIVKYMSIKDFNDSDMELILKEVRRICELERKRPESGS